MIIGLNNPYAAFGEFAEEVADNPFTSEEGVDKLVNSLRASVSDIDCFFDSSVPLGHPLRYIVNNSPAERDPSRMKLFSRHYEQFRPLFLQENVRITPRVKAALVRLIFYGRLALIRDPSPEAKQLDRQFDLLHRAACHKASHAPGTLYFGLPREADDELLSKIYEIASRREELVGLATRNRTQSLMLNSIAEKFSSGGKSLPIELIQYRREFGEYERKSLYKTKELMEVMQ
ncbi:MAG: hypothetical protein MUF61_00660 [archaeon]|jgi:hypothetical protein|nr:hypothetical protein [archaeon]